MQSLARIFVSSERCSSTTLLSAIHYIGNHPHKSSRDPEMFLVMMILGAFQMSSTTMPCWWTLTGVGNMVKSLWDFFMCIVQSNSRAKYRALDTCLDTWRLSSMIIIYSTACPQSRSGLHVTIPALHKLATRTRLTHNAQRDDDTLNAQTELTTSSHQLCEDLLSP